MNTPAPISVENPILGCFEGVEYGVAFGWVVASKGFKGKLRVELVHDNIVVASGAAIRVHARLVMQGVGDGRYGFTISIPPALADGRAHTLRARVANSDVWLQGVHDFLQNPDLRSAVEGVSAGVVFGWLAIASSSENSPQLAISVNGAQVGEVATRFARPDISPVGLPAEARGFVFDLSSFLSKRIKHNIQIVEIATGKALPGSPLVLTPRSGWGCVDELQGVEVSGWVALAYPVIRPARVEVLIDGESIGTATADWPRPDLGAIGIQNYRCGFRISVPPHFYDGLEHLIDVSVEGFDVVFRGCDRPFRIALDSSIDICETGRVAGWITNRHSPKSPVRMDAWVDGKLNGTYSADLPRPDVSAALGLPPQAVGTGFDFSLPRALRPGQVRRLKLCPPGRCEALTGQVLLVIDRAELIRHAEQLAADLRGGLGKSGHRDALEALRFIMPQWLGMLRQGYTQGRALHCRITEEPHAALLAEQAPGVDVIVPVYKGREETLACLASVLRARSGANMALIVINDASPDAQLTEALRLLAQAEGFTLLENETNIGFVGSVNRGMRLHSARDVVLLNSDTLVPPGWLERLKKTAYAEANIGTVTPLSNRATILSLPQTLFDNNLPAGLGVDEMDALCREVNAGVRVDIPTAVGFCMYIRREVLRTTGLFDEARWGKGYGEENDFCVQASALGWRHVAACDVFVQHHGAVSFAGDSTARIKENLGKLYALYPDYPERVQAFIRADPLREPRARVNLRLLQRAAPRFVLHVVHGWGGGTEIAVRDLCECLAMGGEAALILRASTDGSMLLAQPAGGLPVGYAAGAPIAAVIRDLRTLDVWHVHIHHTVGFPKEVWEIATALKITFDFTLHDYFSVCPRVNFINSSGVFCGQPDAQTCTNCLSAGPLVAETHTLYQELGGTIAAWRKFHLAKLKKARVIFAPSKDAAQRISQYAGLSQLRYKPHPAPDIEFRPRSRPRVKKLCVAVIGAIGLHKGHRLLLETANYAQQKKLAIEFVIVGYTCDDGAYAVLNNVKILGAYSPTQLPGLLANAGCTVALFLSIWPETFSYTLSEAWRGGLYPVVTDLGAQAERVKRAKVGVVINPESNPEDVVDACEQAAAGARGKRNITGAAYTRFLSAYYGLKPPPVRKDRI